MFFQQSAISFLQKQGGGSQGPLELFLKLIRIGFARPPSDKDNTTYHKVRTQLQSQICCYHCIVIKS